MYDVGKTLHTHLFKIFGNVFELQSQRKLNGKPYITLHKRFFVSPEFIELFYKIHDDQFDQLLFDRLSNAEQQTLATVLTFLRINNREFNIAMAKVMRSMYERFKTIEGAIKAGNISQQLHDDYVDLMKTLSRLGFLPKQTATGNIKSMGKTLREFQKRDTTNLSDYSTYSRK
jgi:hypothetical protein